LRRILIPTDDVEGTMLASHFGRAPCFVLFELDDSNGVVSRQIHQNTGSHVGGQGHTHDNVLSLRPHAVVVAGMGPRGLASFQSQGVAVLQANSTSVDEIVTAYGAGKLPELTEGCHDAHHK